MNSGNAQLLVERRSWTSIFLWSFGIALLIFALIWLRIGYLDPYLNDNTDTILFGMPHILMASWGTIIGFSLLNNNKVLLAPIRYPFLTLLLTVIFFGIIIVVSISGTNIGQINNKNYIVGVFLYLFSISLIYTLVWITVPFLVGYVIGNVAKKLCSISTIIKNN